MRDISDTIRRLVCAWLLVAFASLYPRQRSVPVAKALLALIEEVQRDTRKKNREALVRLDKHGAMP